MRLGVSALGIVDVVRRDERQLELSREANQDVVQDRLLRQAVVLELHVEAPRLEGFLEAREHRASARLAFLEHRLRDQAPHAAGERDEPLRVARQVVEGHGRRARPRLGRGRHVAARYEANEVPVALVRRGEHGKVVTVSAPRRTPRARSRGWAGLRLSFAALYRVMAPNMLP